MRGKRHARLLLALAAVTISSCGSGGSGATTTLLPATSSSVGMTSTSEGADVASLFDNSTWVAFQGAGPESPESVSLTHPDGTGLHEIDNDIDGYGQLPDWSPDGTKVVMASRGPFPETLYEYDVASETSRVLFECLNPCFGDDEPAYSPDGSRVAFIRALGPWDEVADAPSDCGLWIGEVATGEVEQITSNEACDREAAPRWSPDESRIAYFRERVDNSGIADAVFVIDPATRDETQLTDWELNAGYPDWSPNGNWILFCTHPFWSFNDDQVISNLYRMRPDGSELEQLTFYDDPSMRANQPRYTPDGEWIVFTMDTGSAREIWVMPAEGGEPMALIKGGIHTHPIWQP